jgi:hypothetical protein
MDSELDAPNFANTPYIKALFVPKKNIFNGGIINLNTS